MRNAISRIHYCGKSSEHHKESNRRRWHICISWRWRQTHTRSPCLSPQHVKENNGTGTAALGILEWPSSGRVSGEQGGVGAARRQRAWEECVCSVLSVNSGRVNHRRTQSEDKDSSVLCVCEVLSVRDELVNVGQLLPLLPPSGSIRCEIPL